MARVTIDFFRLNGRERLLEGRANIIAGIHLAFELSNHGRTEALKDAGRFRLDLLTSARSAHTNCARCFASLCLTHPARAQDFAEEARNYLMSGSGA